MNLKTLFFIFILAIFVISCNESIIQPDTNALQTNSLKSLSLSSNHYVSTTGSDSNPGTYALPYLTIQKGVDMSVAGDSVIVKDGIYKTSNPTQMVISWGKTGTPSQPIVIKSEHKWGAVLNGQNNLTTNCFDLGHASSYVIVDGFEILGFQHGGVLLIESSHNITIRNNKIHAIGKQCYDSDSGQLAIYLNTCSNMTIDRNVIYDIGRFAPGENGCTPSNSYWKNHDHGIYISADVNGLIVSRNIIYDCTAGWCIQFYNGSSANVSNVSVINNTFSDKNTQRVGHIILSQGHYINLLIANNLFYSPLTNAVNIDGYGTAETSVIENNMTFGGTISNVVLSGLTFTKNLNNTDPKVVSSGTYDFRLQSTSPAINAGVNVGLTSDYLGNLLTGLPSIGAFEYQGLSSTIYYNVLTSASVSKNDCGTGSTGSTVTYTVLAKKYSSSVSQATADSLASTDLNTNKQVYANANGTCTAQTVIYYNTQISASASKNDCGTGSTGSTVTYTVSAKKYSSTVSQAAADNLASTDLNTNKQAYANANGTCTAQSVIPVGLTTVGGLSEKGDKGFWMANNFIAGSNITVSKMNLYVGTASGKARLGIYSSISGQPGKLLSQTGEISLSNGWNSGNLRASLNLISGVNYWLVIELTSSTTTMYYNSVSGRMQYKSYTYGNLPSSAPLNRLSGGGIYSVYAN